MLNFKMTDLPSARVILPLLFLMVLGCSPHATRTRLAQDTAEDAATVDVTRIWLRVDGSLDGKMMDTTKTMPYSIHVARLEDRESPVRLRRVTTPSKEAGREGWIRFELQPGRYFLLLVPPGVDQRPPAVAYHIGTARYGRFTHYDWRGSFWDPGTQMFVIQGPVPPDFVPLPGFQFEISEGLENLYIGTLTFACVTGSGFMGGSIDHCTEIEVADESDRFFDLLAADRGDPQTGASPMIDYGHARRPMVRSPAAPRPSVALHPTEAGLGVRYAKPYFRPASAAGGSGTMGDLVWVLIHGGARAVAALTAEAREHNAQHCADALGESLAEGQLESIVADVIAESLQEIGPAAGSGGVPLGISVQILELGLKGCVQPKDLCLYMLAWVEADDGVAPGLFSGLFVHTDRIVEESPQKNRQKLYQLPTRDASACHAMTDWCNEGGPALLRSQLEEAAHAVGREVAERLLMPAS